MNTKSKSNVHHLLILVVRRDFSQAAWFRSFKKIKAKHKSKLPSPVL